LSKKRDDSYFAAGRRRKRKSMMIVIPIIVALTGAAAAGALVYQPPKAVAINGVECHKSEQLNYHVHAHLDVFVDGNRHEVPAKIGILSSPSCFFWLHTHDGDGVIHIEAPQTREFTLGQFLDIWEQTKSDSQEFFNSIADLPVKVYVDGSEFEGNYRDIQLTSRKQIVLAHGEPPTEIPAYDFGNLR
jgi:hypothetical protein